ncbi:hypothetical protein K469DRAFT_755346 [Zopfia rhizophila CBS 207.26]|uniref:Uncharacterized protein n=1 Tax=Zopfia rhizophila CBS 207.26 TaxID=1314779 RepID=A0A6A6DCC1_9PEZI|nr:hypothetical protein K469DRAFT_755346 [Zopfia rhizophila CBS 207.26]
MAPIFHRGPGGRLRANLQRTNSYHASTIRPSYNRRLGARPKSAPKSTAKRGSGKASKIRLSPIHDVIVVKDDEMDIDTDDDLIHKKPPVREALDPISAILGANEPTQSDLEPFPPLADRYDMLDFLHESELEDFIKPIPRHCLLHCKHAICRHVTRLQCDRKKLQCQCAAERAQARPTQDLQLKARLNIHPILREAEKRSNEFDYNQDIVINGGEAIALLSEMVNITKTQLFSYSSLSSRSSNKSDSKWVRTLPLSARDTTAKYRAKIEMRFFREVYRYLAKRHWREPDLFISPNLMVMQIQTCLLMALIEYGTSLRGESKEGGNTWCIDEASEIIRKDSHMAAVGLGGAKAWSAFCGC